MKVLAQEWHDRYKDLFPVSISKDQAQLDEAIKSLAKKEDRDEDSTTIPYEEAWEVEIPDDSVFAEMVEMRGTVFLHRDEEDILNEE